MVPILSTLFQPTFQTSSQSRSLPSLKQPNAHPKGFLRKFAIHRPAHLSTKPIAMSKLSKEEMQTLPGVQPTPDPATKDFCFQQTMLRIRDPKPALDFYTGIMGMTLLHKFDFQDMKFSLYFLGYYPASEIPEDPVERARWLFSKSATLELTHNWGTESDPDFNGYASGNTEPGKGFGHIGIVVPDVNEACKRFEELGVEFQKKPRDGKMKDIAFVRDCDGYWIEILSKRNAEMIVNWNDGI